MKTRHLRSLKGAGLLMLFLIYHVHGEIRCYCNESKCVTSSYMCKSQLGMCFTHTKVKDGVMSIVSGCADSLQQEPRMSTCAGSGTEANVAEVTVNETSVISNVNGVEVKETRVVETVSLNNNNAGPPGVDQPLESGLKCCTSDMCNYRDSNEITITIDTKTNDKGGDGISSKRTEHSPKAPKDLWFKAAVIAVPIAGGFILILLVLLAVRMLRTDSRQHKRLIQIRRERSLTKAQLYVTDHFIDKEKDKTINGHCDKLNQTQSKSVDGKVNSVVHNSQNSKRENSHSHTNSKCHHHHHHRSHHQKQCHPKLTTNRDGHTYEQIVSPNSDSSSSPCDPSCPNARTTPYPSVILWGKSNQTDTADVV